MPNPYKNRRTVDYVEDTIGADVARDLLRVAVVEQDAGVQTHAQAAANGASLASGGTLSRSLEAPGAETLRGRVVRASTSYDLAVDWEDSNGNVLFTDTIATGAAGGTETALNEPAISAYATVRVVDAGSASGPVTLSAHLR